VVSGLNPEMTAVLSEIEVIKSDSLMRRLVDKLGLEGDPEFNSDLIRKPFWSNYLRLSFYIPEDWLVAVGLKSSESVLSEEDLREAVRTRVLTSVKSRLSVTPIRRSMVISIDFLSKSAKKATQIVNTVAELYILDQLESKFEATKRATAWLGERLESLKGNVENAEKAVDRFRAVVAVQSGQRTKITDQQIAGLNTQLILAQTKRAEAEARLEQVQGLIDGGATDLATAAEVLNSLLIQSLRTQEAKVTRKVSELESRYGPRHPNMIKAKNELKDLRKSIELEVRKIAQSLRNEMSVAKAREEMLQKNLDKLEAKNSKQTRSAIRLRELEREAKASQILYSNFLNRFKETRTQEDLQQADARILSKASVPDIPTFPRKKLIIISAGLIGFVAGIILVLLLETIRNSFRDTRELESETQLPVLAVVPKVKNTFGLVDVTNEVAERPASTISEAIRNLATAIRLSDVDIPPKIIGVGSTTPGEGKTTLVIWLALQAAMSGKKVLLIDCDLRRPQMHNRFRIENNQNLVGYLAGECELSDTIKRIEPSGLHVIPGLSAGGNSFDLISSKKFSDTLETLRDKYDCIYLDSPPILAVSDSRIIGRLADKLVYAVRWGLTPKDLVQVGLKAVTDASIPLAGLVLTQLDTKKHSTYGYYDYGYYYGKYKDYYTSKSG
jgi:succinoglycan biosynthesis transport protein ExoP